MTRLPAYLTEPLRWARAEGWRPLYPKTRRDGLHTWVSQPKDPQARRYPPGTSKVAIDVAGLVTVQRMTRDGWVTKMVLTVGDGRAVVDVLAALCLLPRRYSAVYPLLRAQIADEMRAEAQKVQAAIDDPATDPATMSTLIDEVEGMWTAIRLVEGSAAEAERGAVSEWALWAARQSLDVAADGACSRGGPLPTK